MEGSKKKGTSKNRKNKKEEEQNIDRILCHREKMSEKKHLKTGQAMKFEIKKKILKLFSFHINPHLEKY